MGSYKVQNTGIGDVTITLASDGEEVTLVERQEMYITDNDWDSLTNAERQSFSIVSRRGHTGDSRALSTTRTFIESGNESDGPFYMSMYDATAAAVHVIGDSAVTGNVKLYGTIEDAAADQNWVLIKTFTLAPNSSEIHQIGSDKPFYMLKVDLGSITGGTNEVQEIDVAATGGTFTITYAGQTTSAINYNAVAATVQSALEALSNLAPGDVVVSGGVGQSGGGTPYVLTFGGTLAGTDLTQVTTGVGSLTGSTQTAAVTTTTAGGAGRAVSVYGIKAHGK